MQNLIIIYLVFFASSAIYGQNETIQDINEENISTDTDIEDLEDIEIERLTKKINLNTAGPEELITILKLTPSQANAIIQHIMQYGNLRNIFELQTIEFIDIGTINRVKDQITVLEPQLEKTFRSFKLQDIYHEIGIQMSRKLERSKGYKLNESDPQRYQGCENRFLLKYTGRIEKRILFGLTSEKDAGEKLEYGFASAFLKLNLDGKIKQIILGDYLPNFGQGLNLGTGLSLGKSSEVMSVIKPNVGTRPNRSSNESGFMRGFQIKMELNKNLSLESGISYRKLDANTTIDTLGAIESQSIKTSGYRRNEKEIDNIRSIAKSLNYFILNYRVHNLSASISIVNTFDRSIGSIDIPTYKKLIPDRRILNKIGFNGSYLIRNILIFCEESIQIGTNIPSSLSGAIIAIDPKLDVSILHRYYPFTYDKSTSTAFSESGANNEHGLYIGFSLGLPRHHKLKFYQDYFRSSALKYRIDGPATGNETMLEFSKESRYGIRYKFKLRKTIKQYNESGIQQINRLEDNIRLSGRFHLEIPAGKNLLLRHRIELSAFKSQFGGKSNGYLMYCDVQKKITMNSKIGIRMTFFNCDDFNSRIYAHENDFSGSNPFKVWQDRGNAISINLQHHVNKHIQINFRFAGIRYDDIEEIGSGLDAISGNRVNEIKIELKTKINRQ